MKTKKKNRFLTFCFSLLPGAAEMYMGFMKTGVSLMSLFCLLCAVGTVTNMGAVLVIDVVVWFYGFFHANHLASLSDEEFDEVKDKYLFGRSELPGITALVQKYHSIVAALLIVFGVLLLWSAGTDILDDMGYHVIADAMWNIGNYVPSILIGAGIIYAGIRMIQGKKVPLAEQPILEEKQDEEAGEEH